MAERGGANWEEGRRLERRKLERRNLKGGEEKSKEKAGRERREVGLWKLWKETCLAGGGGDGGDDC